MRELKLFLQAFIPTRQGVIDCRVHQQRLDLLVVQNPRFIISSF